MYLALRLLTLSSLEVTETEPGIKGQQCHQYLEAAVLETGAEICVPLFMNEGDKIRISTLVLASTWSVLN